MEELAEEEFAEKVREAQSFEAEAQATQKMGELLTPLTQEARERLLRWAYHYFNVTPSRFY